MKINLFKNRIWNLKSERGFTLLELIMVVTVTGIITPTLVIPFTNGIKQATRPEIYATATYLAQQRIEEQRSSGYTSTSGGLGTSTSTTTKKGRDYDEQVITKYVDHDDVNNVFVDAASPPSEFIKVTVTVSNTIIPDDIVIWTILAKDFYDPDAN